MLPVIFQSQQPRLKKDRRAKPVDPRLSVPPITVVGTNATSPVSMSKPTRLAPLIDSRHRPTASRVAQRQEDAIDKARQERRYRLTHVVHSSNFVEHSFVSSSTGKDSPGMSMSLPIGGNSEEREGRGDGGGDWSPPVYSHVFDEHLSSTHYQQQHLGVRSPLIRRAGAEFDDIAPPNRKLVSPKVKLVPRLVESLASPAPIGSAQMQDLFLRQERDRIPLPEEKSRKTLCVAQLQTMMPQSPPSQRVFLHHMAEQEALVMKRTLLVSPFEWEGGPSPWSAAVGMLIGENVPHRRGVPR